MDKVSPKLSLVVDGNRPKKPIVIVGANGFIGSHLLYGLMQRGCKVHGLVRPGANCARLKALDVEAWSAVKETSYQSATLEKFFGALGPSVVINAVGYGLDPGQRDLEIGFQANIRVALDVAEAATNVGANTVHIGSAYEYAISESRIDESTPVSPESFHGITKASASLLLRLKAREISQRILVVRPFGIYGPTDQPTKLIPAIISACATGRPLDLSDGAKVRDYTYIDDFVDALHMIIHSEADWPEALNVASGRPVRLRYIAERICAIMDADRDLLRWNQLPARRGDPFSLVANTALADLVFGWKTTIDLEEGLRRTIANFRASKT